MTPRRPRARRLALLASALLAAGVVAPAALAAPTVSISGVSDALLGLSEASSTVSWDGSESGTYEIRKGGGADCAAGSALAPPVGGAYTTPATEPSVVPRASLDEGANTVRVCLTGVSGTGFADTTITVDTGAPTGEITAPAANANLRGASVTVSSDSADGGSGVQKAVFERSPAGAGTWTQIGADDTSFPYQVTFNTTLVTDGLYDLRVTTTDDAGNATTSVTRTVRVDNTAPSGAVTAPAANANLRGASVTVSSDSADGGSGVQKAVFERSPAGANTWTQIGLDDTTAPYGVTFDTTGVVDGLYDLRVITTDNAGNATTSAARTVRVDNTAPTGSITAPAASANLRGASVSVSASSADGGSGVQKAVFERSPAGAGTWTPIGGDDTSAPYGVTFDTTGVVDGLYDLRVITTDNAGNATTSATVTVRVDNTAPTNPSLFPVAPAQIAPAWTNDNTIDVTATGAADAGSGVDGFSVVWDTSPTTVPDTTKDTSATTLTSPAEPDGTSYYVHVRTLDLAGNWSASAVHLGPFQVDATEPTTTLAFPLPLPAGVYNDTSWATGCSVAGACGGSSDDTGGVFSGVASVTITLQRASDSAYWNGASWGAAPSPLPATGTASWVVALDAALLDQEGTYTVRATAVDTAGNADATPASASFRTDRTGPDSAIVNPAQNGAPLKDEGWDAACGVAGAGICGTATADDNATPVAHVDVSIRQVSSGLYWNGTSFASQAEMFNEVTSLVRVGSSLTWNWFYALPHTALPQEGTYVIRARAIDNAPNVEAALPSRTVILDRTQPNAAVSFPLGLHNPTAWAAGCATPGFCGTSVDVASGVKTVEVAIQRTGTGLWWDGGAFAAGAEQYLPATLANGSWARAFGAGNFPADGNYLLRLRLTDNVGFERVVDLPFGLDTAAPDTSIDSGPSGTVDQATATFAFSSSEQGAGFQCRLDGAAFASCASPTTLTGLANGQHAFDVRAVDGAGNIDASPASRTWIVNVGPFQPPADTTAPGPVTGVKAFGDDGSVKLTWTSPTDADLAAIEVVRRPGKGAATSVVFSGKAATFTDRGLKNGTTYTYTLVAIDASGNRSTSTSIKGKPILRLLFAPLSGAIVRTPPTLSWRTVKGASFYNVQLYRGKTKVLSIWPTGPKLKLGKAWRFEGRSQTLSAGVYTWYVWPAFGTRSNATYGKLLGKATFVVPKAKTSRR